MIANLLLLSIPFILVMACFEQVKIKRAYKRDVKGRFAEKNQVKPEIEWASGNTGYQKTILIKRGGEVVDVIR